MSLLLEEISALPFELDANSAQHWLDNLPVGNTRECCELLMPTLLSLRSYPMRPRLRLELIETCRPALHGVAHSLITLILGHSFPLEKSALKIAKLALRFHFEAAETYRQIIQCESYSRDFTHKEQAGIISQALDQLFHCQLRTAMVYERQSEKIWAAAASLYQQAEELGLLEKKAALGGEAVAPPALVYQRMLLFRLAITSRLSQPAIQALFRQLAEDGGLADKDELATRLLAVFRFNATQPENIKPIPLNGKFKHNQHLAPPTGLFQSKGLDREDKASRDGLRSALPRLGDQLSCREQANSATASLAFGFKAMAMTLRFYEANDSSSRGADYWPALHHVEFSALQALPGKWDGEMGIAADTAVDSDEEPKVSLIAAKIPGYFMLDTGSYSFRTGYLIGLDTQGEWMQIAVVRAGQVKKNRFWHSAELLAGRPRLCTVRPEGSLEGRSSGFLLDNRQNNGDVSVIVGPVNWRSGEIIRLQWAQGDENFRIFRLLEANSDFCQFLLEAI